MTTVIPPFTYPDNTGIMTCKVTQPHSRGSSHIKSTNPFDNPLVDTGFFSVGADSDNAVACLAMARDFPFPLPTSDIPDIVTELLPGQMVSGGTSPVPSQTMNYVTTQGYDGQLSSGTARLGTDAGTSVVNTNLVVFSTANLRVADASVVPQPVSRGLAAFTFVVGIIAANNALGANYVVVPDATHGNTVVDLSHGFQVVTTASNGNDPTCDMVGGRNLNFDTSCSTCDCSDAAEMASAYTSWWIAPDASGNCRTMDNGGVITVVPCSNTNNFLCRSKTYKP